MLEADRSRRTGRRTCAAALAHRFLHGHHLFPLIEVQGVKGTDTLAETASRTDVCIHAGHDRVLDHLAQMEVDGSPGSGPVRLGNRIRYILRPLTTAGDEYPGGMGIKGPQLGMGL